MQWSHLKAAFLTGLPPSSLALWTWVQPRGPWTKSSFQFSSQGGSEAGLKVLIWGGRRDWRNAQMSKPTPGAFSAHWSIVSGLWKHFISCTRQRTITQIHNKLQPSYWLKFTIPLPCFHHMNRNHWAAKVLPPWQIDQQTGSLTTGLQTCCSRPEKLCAHAKISGGCFSTSNCLLSYIYGTTLSLTAVNLCDLTFTGHHLWPLLAGNVEPGSADQSLPCG